MNFIVKKTIFILSLLFLVSINMACKKKWFTRVTYDGNVYYANGTPAVGVSVIFQACGSGKGSAPSQSLCTNNKFTLGTTTTDATGHFHTDAAESGIYFVVCNNVGWNYYGVSESDLSSPNFTKIIIQ